MRILLVEDNEDDVILLEEILDGSCALPVEVVTADRVSTGVSHLDRGDFDIILLDLSPPDSKGLTTLKKM